MPSYRLVTGNGAPVETFEATDDVEARAYARGLAYRHLGPGPQDPRRRSDFSLQRLDGVRWTSVIVWVPGPRAQPEGDSRTEAADWRDGGTRADPSGSVG